MQYIFLTIRVIAVFLFVGIVFITVARLVGFVRDEMRHSHPVCAELRRLRDNPLERPRFDGVTQQEKDWCNVPAVVEKK